MSKKDDLIFFTKPRNLLYYIGDNQLEVAKPGKLIPNGRAEGIHKREIITNNLIIRNNKEGRTFYIPMKIGQPTENVGQSWPKEKVTMRRAYTMKEMRSIVEYIVDHSLYGEVKGRKMWMDFSSTGLTSRTWQSLKETFLKRILPDIHNPYYKLSIEQIRSFRTGLDVAKNTAKNAAKLELRTASTSSNKVANEEPRPSTSKTNDSNKSTGEDGKKCLKISSNRASLETVVLGTEECYETAEDLIRELDSDINAADNVQAMEPRRSLRDCITYSEPLTPLLQDALHDWDSEDSESERPLEIDLNVHKNNNNKEEIPENQDNSHISAANGSVSKNTEQAQENFNKIQGNESEVLKNGQGSDSPKKKSLMLRKNQKVPKNKVSKRKLKNTAGADSKETNSATHEEGSAASVKNAKPQKKRATPSSGEITETQNSIENINKLTPSDDTNKVTPVTQNGVPEKTSQNATNSITDSLLPNNQEALQEKQIPQNSHLDTSRSPNSLVVPKTCKKRSISTDLGDTKRKITKRGSEKINRKLSKELESTDEVQEAAIVKPNKKKPVEDQQSTFREHHSSKENLESPKKLQENIVAKEKDIESAEPDGSPQGNSQEIIKPKETIPSSNPCLQSVSLFEEGLTSEDSDEALPSTSKENHNKEKQTGVCINNNKIEKTIPEAFIENGDANEALPSTSKEIPNKKKQTAVCINDNRMEKTITEALIENGDVNATSKKNEKEVIHTNALKLRKIKENGQEKWGVVTENVHKDVFTKDNDILVLRSHSESDSEEIQQKRNKQTRRSYTSKHQRNQVLDNLFGNSSGVGHGKAHRKNCYQDGPSRRLNMQSSDSEWASDSGSELSSPPARSHSRRSWKHLKPSSYKIRKQSDMLLVEMGGQLYPLVRNGNPLLYLPNDESDEDEKKEGEYWKLKYIKMRKQYSELIGPNPRSVEPAVPEIKPKEIYQNGSAPPPPRAKRHSPHSTIKALETKSIEREETDTHEQPPPIERCESPILPTTSFKKTTLLQQKGIHSSSETTKDDDVPQLQDKSQPMIEKPIEIPTAVEAEQPTNQQTIEEVPVPKPTNDSAPLKIKFAKDNVEWQIEGNAQNIQPFISDIMKIFSDHAKPGIEQRKRHASSTIDLNSGDTTPGIVDIDEDTHKRVTDVERKIFEEIEMFARLEEGTPHRRKRSLSVENKPEPNILSKRRQSIASPDVNRSLSEPRKVSRRRQTSIGVDNSMSSRPETGNAIKRQKTSIGNEVIPNGNATTSSRTPSKRQRQKKKQFDDEDSQILYKFPSPEPNIRARGRPKSRLGSKIVKPSSTPPENRARGRPKSSLDQKLSNSKYGHQTPTILSEPNRALQSNESSQGYQDSDISLVPINIRRKRKLSLQITKARKSMTKNQTSVRKQKQFYWDASGESSNSSFRSLPKRNTAARNSSQNTEEYRSESYQLLMPPPRNLRRMEIISETSPCPNEMNPAGDLRLSPASQNMNEADQSKTNSINIEMGNSSSVSLPLSPELSIVENINISKEVFQASAEYFPTINELQESAEMVTGPKDSYIISKLDISVPLMAQECNLKSYQKQMADSNRSIEDNNFLESVNTNKGDNSTFNNAVSVSESFLEKIDTVNLKTHTLSESLNVKLRNLLLESAKKMATQNKTTEESMEHDGKDPILPIEMPKKTKSKKRCSSTPQKRRVTKKSKPLEMDDVIEEERMEFCSSGRKSCPPIISVFCAEDSNRPYESIEDLNTTDKTIQNKKKGKRAKDIIKVKITRPKKKSNKKNSSKMSLLTDSGINDTISSGILQSLNGSVDLIHNHSETCLHANECLSKSIEFVNNSKSLISVNSSTQSEDKENFVNNIRTTLSPEFFSNDAQDGSDKSCELPASSNGEVPRSPVILYGTSVPSVTSLMTEDLSDESPKAPRPSTWHLFSEDETNTNTMNIAPAPCTVKPNTYLSNLKQLFPIACAVPDLSTITERSETDGNSKSTVNTNMDSNTRNAFLLKFEGGESSINPNF